LALFIAMFAAVLARVGRVLRDGVDEAKWPARLAFVICFSELFPLFTHASLNFGVGPVMFWLLSGSAITIAVRDRGRGVTPFSG